MSDFLDKAKSMAEGLKDKVDDVLDSVSDKLPEGIKSKVEDVREKVDGFLPGHDDATEAEAPAAE